MGSRGEGGASMGGCGSLSPLSDTRSLCPFRSLAARRWQSLGSVTSVGSPTRLRCEQCGNDTWRLNRHTIVTH